MNYNIKNILLYLKKYNIEQYNVILHDILDDNIENELFYVHVFSLDEIDYLLLDYKFSDYDSTYSVEINKSLYLNIERELKLKQLV